MNFDRAEFVRESRARLGLDFYKCPARRDHRFESWVRGSDSVAPVEVTACVFCGMGVEFARLPK